MAANRAQSAMEYLVTYGWAILVVMVVLGALFSLGVFSTTDLGPRLQPGGCQVNRPNGALSTQFMTLEGTCNGEIPQYVGYFDGSTSDVAITTGPKLTNKPITFVAWVMPTSYVYGTYVIGKSTYGAFLRVWNQQVEWDIYNGAEHNLFYTLPAGDLNKWLFTAGTYDGNTLTLYINNVNTSTYVGALTPTVTTDLGIGACLFCGPGQFYSGYLSNLQIYNSSLSPSDVQTLYLEGIGGAPVDTLHLMGWWPLNGNANDYSGNKYNGATTNVKFISSWTSGYVPPSVK